MSHATTMLAAIEARIEGRLDADIESYGIAGRQIQKIPMEKVIEMHDRYLKLVDQEKAAENVAKGLGSGRKVHTRFNN